MGGTKKKGHFLEKKRAPTKGNSQSEIYNFLDVGIYPYIVITIIRDNFNICFTLYTIQDIALASYFAVRKSHLIKREKTHPNGVIRTFS